MFISDLNHIEAVTESTVVGGWYDFYEKDKVEIIFDSTNKFETTVNSPKTYSNSAAAGAKGVANNYTNHPTYSFTKADTLAVTEYLGSSFSASTSAAVINKAYY